MKLLRWTLATALLGLVIAGAQPLQAQSFLLPGTPEKGFWLEVSHPEVKAFDVTVPSTAWYASGRHPLMERLYGVAELPFAYGKLDVTGSEGSTEIGNPYLGLEYAAHDRVWFEMGGRLPLTTADESSFGDVIGFLADPLRGEAFMEDIVPISGAVSYVHPLDMGVRLQARGGVTSMIWTGDEEDGETVTMLDYGVLALVPRGAARFGGGISGRWNASADEDGFSENSLHQLGLSADYSFGRFRPGLIVRVPLDEASRDLVRSSAGLYLQVRLP